MALKGRRFESGQQYRGPYLCADAYVPTREE